MAHSETGAARAGGKPRDAVVYVYGVVPADVEENPEATGVGEPPSPVKLVRSGEIAALVGEIPSGVALGTPEDLTAHARVLDSAAAEVPVLPLRFGAVVTDLDAVANEFLEPNAESFAGILRDLEGRAQFVLRGRYDGDAMIRELMDEDPRIGQLRGEIHGKPEEVTRDARIALGELIGRAVQAKREADTRVLASALDELGFPVVAGEATNEWDAANVACLVELSRQDELREAAERFAEQQDGRIDLRLLGPMAAYDFVLPAEGSG
ncbi:GvpL/GvpF family gas vesicle protein [Actinospica sp. MGRD01-02]|uniref:GvpL/GvpF family gas vesicle protein n=1 Tax=Actinospica acidithermotolerans TaxID=2828514 RepID=A0A941EH37_9ACTN|nr:GvpL/GvpF family gas vesicle protein [Actinospica acidithermotolerans]MBR7830268.1 GvpL/GvpF family gas vesicle protein [Actinospica acidithermotolerans]